MCPLPDVNHAYSLIKQDERQKQGYIQDNNTAFMAIGSGSSANYVNKYNRKPFGNNMMSFGNNSYRSFHSNTFSFGP